MSENAEPVTSKACIAEWDWAVYEQDHNDRRLSMYGYQIEDYIDE